MPNWVKNIITIEGPADDIAKALNLMRDKSVEGDIDFNNVIPMPKRLNIVSGGYNRKYVALYLKSMGRIERDRLMDELGNRSVSFYETYLQKYGDSFTIANGFMDIPDEKLSWMEKTFEKDYASISPTSMEAVGRAYIDNILEYGHDTWYDWRIDNWGTKWNACECKIGDDYLEFETAWSAPFPIIEDLSRRFPELIFHHDWADEDLGYNCGRHSYQNGVESPVEECDSNDDAHEFACMLWGYSPDDLEDEE